MGNKKKQEMSQVYYGSKNEFIFGETGGKGKNLSSFLKNLSLTGGSTDSINSTNIQENPSFEEINKNIYGSLKYNSPSSNNGGSILKPTTHRTVSTSSIKHNIKHIPTARRSHSSQRYTDLDDDWDSKLDEVEVDPLYPNLITPTTKSKPKRNHDSLDYEDLQAKQEINKLNQLNNKYAKFRKILASDSIINLQDLRKLSWNGIPNELRALSWLLLLGYLPTNKSRQSSTLKRKRQEYIDGISGIYTEDIKSKQLYHQIKIDVKRTNPTIKLYSRESTQESLRKILYLWAIRHPASGYVQGINDLCTPFYQIFLNNYLWQLQRKDQEEDLFIPGYLDSNDEKEQQLLSDSNLMNYDLDNFDPSLLSDRVISIIEADTYWCLSRLLENITDNYIHQQPGIIRQVNELRNLISKIDLDLLKHFDSEGVEFIQFSFRWMNCLLMRELPIQLIIRMWDTYLSESPLGFNTFHTYVCAAFLIKFSNELQQKDFQEILLFLQSPPTSNWKEKDVELMLSEAFIWQSLYKNASAHLR
ncbi:unnamed protein product [Candida verbasci]|uniref:Oxidant-induced cell-cycle arrest protein 5 n=1 Tax=Candida verbasci TaxID=1227364 RepID=A0A9W4U0F4_9ASCO|nr:unnamed protein product [Candida verbasci]